MPRFIIGLLLNPTYGTVTKWSGEIIRRTSSLPSVLAYRLLTNKWFGILSSPACQAPPRLPLHGVYTLSTTNREGTLMYGYLIDMDGVIYRGGHLIAGADRFVQELRAADIPFFFLTNNSQRTRRDVSTKLQRLGIDADE